MSFQPDKNRNDAESVQDIHITRVGVWSCDACAGRLEAIQEGLVFFPG